MVLKSVRKVNEYFRNATRQDIDRLLSTVVLSERQGIVFDMFYIKRKDIGFISDTLNASQSVVKRELKSIRNKILPLI